MQSILTGQKFGRWTALYKIDGRWAWHCKCECGNEKDVLTQNLKNGKSRSCGCLKNEIYAAIRESLPNQPEQRDLYQEPPNLPEEWREHPTYPKYQVSNQGQVRRWLKKAKRWKIFTATPMKSGHLQMHIGGRDGRTKLVHHLVLETFVGIKPQGMQARHLNDNPSDNRLVNLKWGTSAENFADRKRNNKNHEGVKTKNARLTEKTVIEIRRRRQAGESVRSIAKAYGINRSHVTQITRYWIWKHI